MHVRAALARPRPAPRPDHALLPVPQTEVAPRLCAAAGDRLLAATDRAAAPYRSRPPAAWSPRQPVLQGVFEHNKKTMTEQELEAELKANGTLTDPMKDLIRSRHRHEKKYIFTNTVKALLDGNIKPQAKPSSSTTKKRTRREAAGLTNLPHFDPRMVPLFERAMHTPPPVPPTRTLREHLESPNRQFQVYTPTHTQLPKLVKGHGNTVMGHGPEDAVDYWNREGHKQPKSANKAHNSSDKVYHGLEEKYASASSGGSTVSRYRSPSPTQGSHPSYWDRSHPDFDPLVPWHSYANPQDAQKGIRYVSPPPVSSSSSSSTTTTTTTTTTTPAPSSSSSSSSSLPPPPTLSLVLPPTPTSLSQTPILPPSPIPTSSPSPLSTQAPLLPSLSSLSLPSLPSFAPSLPSLGDLRAPTPSALPSFSTLMASMPRTPSPSSSPSPQPSFSPPTFTTNIMPQARTLVRPTALRPGQFPFQQQQQQQDNDGDTSDERGRKRRRFLK